MQATSKELPANLCAGVQCAFGFYLPVSGTWVVQRFSGAGHQDRQAAVQGTDHFLLGSRVVLAVTYFWLTFTFTLTRFPGD